MAIKCKQNPKHIDNSFQGEFPKSGDPEFLISARCYYANQANIHFGFENPYTVDISLLECLFHMAFHKEYV